MSLGLVPPRLADLEAAWSRSDTIFGLLSPAALLAQPIRLRQPLLFYLGHLPAFAWNQLGNRVLQSTSPDAPLDTLFERGIDPEDEYQPASEWPSESAVLAYRDAIRTTLRRRLTDVLAADDGPRTLAMVVEHELMHQETLMYLLHELPEALRRRAPGAPRHGSAIAQEWVSVPAGPVVLGATDGSRFAWDNELPAHEVGVASFQIQKRPVTNEDLREFVRAGGYTRREHWSPGGWEWRARREHVQPHFWTADGEHVRTLHGERPLQDCLGWPAYVSWAEADAYARWSGARLPTEPEVQRAAGSPSGPRDHPWGDGPPEARANLGFQSWGPEPAGSRPAGASGWGVHELCGNGWEWTSTVFDGFPGFVPTHGYEAYSRDFFDGRHYVLLGASWATDSALVRRSFRNWFQPHYPYVFAKFRLARG